MNEPESTTKYAQTAYCHRCQETVEIVPDADAWMTECGHRTWRGRPRHASRSPRTTR